MRWASGKQKKNQLVSRTLELKSIRVLIDKIMQIYTCLAEVEECQRDAEGWASCLLFGVDTHYAFLDSGRYLNFDRIVLHRVQQNDHLDCAVTEEVAEMAED